MKGNGKMTIEAKLAKIMMLNQETEVTNEPEINYSKYNPFIWSERQKKCKKFKKITFILQILLAALIAIFSLLSLWYGTQWGKETLTNLGIDLTKYQNFFVGDIPTDVPKGTKVMVISKENFENISSLALYQWNSTKFLSEGLLNGLLGFSFTGLFLILPLLSFKRGTLIWSATFFSLVILLVGIIAIFSMGLIDQQEVVRLFNSSDKKDFDVAKKILKLIDPKVRITITTVSK